MVGTLWLVWGCLLFTAFSFLDATSSVSSHGHAFAFGHLMQPPPHPHGNSHHDNEHNNGHNSQWSDDDDDDDDDDYHHHNDHDNDDDHHHYDNDDDDDNDDHHNDADSFDHLGTEQTYHFGFWKTTYPLTKALLTTLGALVSTRNWHPDNSHLPPLRLQTESTTDPQTTLPPSTTTPSLLLSGNPLPLLASLLLGTAHFCKVCDGPLCPEIQQDTFCPDGYCMSTIIESFSGAKRVTKGCASLDSCEKLWRGQLFDTFCMDAQTWTIGPSGRNRICHYCCSGDFCNENIYPDVSTLVSFKDDND